MKKFITKKEKASYGFAAAASYMAAAFTQGYLLIFFTDVALLSAEFITILMVIARVWDAMNDPMMGLIIEKTNSKYGKMRPHIFAGSFCILITSILLFVPIGNLNMSENAKMAYAAIMYLCYGMAYTLVDVPAMSLMSVSTPNSLERSNLLSFYVTIGTLGGLLPMGLVPAFESVIPKQWLYFAFAVFSGFFAFFGYMSLFRNCKERFTTKTQKYKLKTILKTACKNKPMILTFLMSMIASPRYLIMPVITYVATYVLHMQTGMAEGVALIVLYLIMGAGMFAGIFLTPALYQKFGYRSACIITGLIGGIFLPIAYFVYKLNIYASFPFLAIGSIALGAYNVLPYPMVGDSLDYLEWKTGERMEGMCFSLNSFVTKFNNAIGFVGLAASLVIFGYVEPVIPGEALAQSQTTINGLYSLLSLVPGISFLLSLIPMFFYDINKKKKAQIVKELEERRGVLSNDSEENIDTTLENTESPSEA